MALNDDLDITIYDHSGILEDGFLPSNPISVEHIDNFDSSMGQEAIFVSTLEHPGTRQPPLRQRRSTIPNAVWEPLKSTIEELYIRQDLQLTDVMARMKQDYGFDASDKMYKKRLRDWKMRKNYTQAMKQELISKLTREETIPDTSPLLGPNGKPLQAQRLLRNVQRKGARVPLVDRRTYEILRRKHLASGRANTICHVQLQQSPECQHVEIVLRSAQTYYSWYLTQRVTKARYTLTCSLCWVFGDISSAPNLLRANSVRRGFALLNRACSGFAVLLKEQPFQLLQELIREFTQSSWGSHCDVRRLVLKMVASCADGILGTRHPIKSLVSSLIEMGQEHLHDLLCKYADLLTDTS
ncbi:hypothetical protein, variant [Phialophora macrospora]|uniref:Clr5 domain-containing protein n=1 Tax=Phialophora macrospora TaxID=1851006 RepID=A0A0D2CK83_9EURO|nr:hypothetical protein, variant [Phialophora macrospora]